MNADKFVVRGQTYDVLSPATFGDYIETVGAACINPSGYPENKLFLAYDDNVQKLFRATAAIAYSELLIKNTNCEPTTMAEALANALSAGGVSYDNTDSGLTASNAQGAIDEVNGKVETVKSDLSNMTNPNLLDNPWFTINQRNFSTSVSGGGYGFDRWRGNYSYDSTNKGILFAQAADWVQQKIGEKDTAAWNNKKMTLSVKYADGSISSGILTYKADGTNWTDVFNDGKLNAQISNVGNVGFTAVVSCSIIAVKLELGSVSTLAMDTIPNYALELAKCRASTAEDPNDTYINLGAVNVGTPNPNLLDNPWFTVNQRGQSTYTSNNNTLYTVDRWQINNSTSASMTVSDSGVSFPNGMSSFFQTIPAELTKKLKGKVVTLSVKFSGTDNVGFFGMFVNGHSWIAESQRNFNNANNGVASVTFTIPNYTDTDVYYIWMYITQNITIEAVKLELGTVSTLAQDTAPNYAKELLECQRYFQRLKKEYTGNYTVFGMVQAYDTANTTVSFMIPTPVKMRAIPTITFSGAVNVVFPSDVIPVSSFDHAGYSTSNMICGDVVLASAPTVASSFGRLFARNDGTAYIDLSADI